MKLHMKRITAPKTWKINRRAKVWSVKPNPIGISAKYTLPIVNIIRDQLKLTTTLKETKFALNNNEIYVNGKRVKDYKRGVGLFDVVYVKPINKYYRLILKDGFLTAVEIPESEAKLNLAKLVNKVILPKKMHNKEITKRVQLNLDDGRNFLTDKVDIATGAGVVYNYEKNEIVSIIPLQPGVLAYVEKGSNEGNLVKVVSKEDENFIVEFNGQKFPLPREYLLPVGVDKPMITVQK